MKERFRQKGLHELSIFSVSERLAHVPLDQGAYQAKVVSFGESCDITCIGR
jgi:hypothetical protein